MNKEFDEDVKAALATRHIIGVAQGIVMERFRLTSVDAAFALLAKLSQNENVKLHDVAQGVVDGRYLLALRKEG